MSTASLWIEHGIVQASALAHVEAELGRRGEYAFAGDYLGRRTSAAYLKLFYDRVPVKGAGRDCNDFPSEAAAQQYFLAQGGPLSDPSGLDRDGDGLACEWGAKLKQNAARHAEVSRPTTALRSYSSGCYTGPRGGRYTISSSGRKNYDGC